MAHGDGSGGGGEEAAWLDLIARFDAPAPAEGNEVPWPEREDLAGPVRVSPADSLPDTAYPSDAIPEPAPFTDIPPYPESSPLPDAPDARPRPDAPGTPGARAFPVRPSGTAAPGSTSPGSTGPGNPGLVSRGPGSGPRDAPIPEDPADDHYVPPPAPPLPRLDPMTKGAWVALFAGPLYLIIATVAGWTVSGLAAFIAVAAFVGGFAVLVLRMDSGPPKDGGGPDDGAVV